MLVSIIILERPRMQAKLAIFRKSFIALCSISCLVILIISFVLKAAEIHHFARFEISAKLITVTVVDVNGNI